MGQDATRSKPAEEYLTVAEFAALVRISEDIIRLRIREGRLPAFQVMAGGHFRIPKHEALDALRAAR